MNKDIYIIILFKNKNFGKIIIYTNATLVPKNEVTDLLKMNIIRL